MSSLKEAVESARRKRILKSGGDPDAPLDTRTMEERIAEMRRERILRSKESETTPNRGSEGFDVLDRIKREVTEIEFRTDLTADEKVKQITHITCAACAGIAVQPIPFADIFILTPIQAYMGTRIAAIRGVPVSESEASDIIKEIIGAIGMGMVAQQVAIGLYKTILPGLAGFTTIPLVYGLSYAVMNVMDAYFVAKASNRRLSASEIKALWGKAKSEGERHGKAEERNVHK